MTAQPIIWSKPYCGVSHITIIPRSHQITMTDHGAFSHAYLLDLRSTSP